MPGQIAHALESRSQAQGRDDDSQIGRHRVLLGQQPHALVKDAGLQSIDFDIAVNNRLSLVDIRVHQRIPSAVDRLADVLRHTIEIVGDGFHLLIENNAHCSAFPGLFHSLRERSRTLPYCSSDAVAAVATPPSLFATRAECHISWT